MLLLIPKETIYASVFGLLETLWKVVEARIDTCLRTSLQMHNFIHSFRARRGMGMSIIELKIA